MLNRTSRLAIILTIVGTGILSFLGLRSFESYAQGMDWDYLVYAKGTGVGLDDAAFAERVDRIASAHRVQISHLVSDTVRPERAGVLFQTPAKGVGQDWLNTAQYPAFSREMEFKVRPFEALGDGYRGGYYFVNGDPATADSVRARFASAGLDPEVVYVDRWGEVLTRLIDFPIRQFTFLAIFLVVALTIAGALLNSRATAIGELHGRSFAQVLIADGISGFRALTVTGVAYVSVAGGILGWYNNLHWFGTFLLTQLALAALVLTALTAVHAATVALAQRTPVIDRIKGDVRSSSAQALTYASRLVAMVIAVGCLATLVDNQALVEEKVDNETVWASTGSNVQLGLKSVADETAARRQDAELGGWLEAQERRGDLIFVQRDVVASLDPAARVGLDPRTDFLTVNSTYLDERPVLDQSGAAVKPVDDRALILVPSELSVDVGALRTELENIVSSELYLRERATGVREQRATSVVRTKPQRLFTYLNHASDELNPYVVNPVVLVLPSKAPVFSPGQWVSAMSNGQTIFRDRAETVESLAANDLLNYVSSVDEVRVTNARQAREIVLRANIFRMSMIAVLAALIATAFGFGVVYTRRSAAAIFARHIHGWSFLRKHRWVIVLDALLMATIAVYWTWTTQVAPGDVAARGLVTSATPPSWSAALVATIAIVMLAVALAMLDRALVRRRAAE